MKKEGKDGKKFYYNLFYAFVIKTARIPAGETRCPGCGREEPAGCLV